MFKGYLQERSFSESDFIKASWLRNEKLQFLSYFFFLFLFCCFYFWKVICLKGVFILVLTFTPLTLFLLNSLPYPCSELFSYEAKMNSPTTNSSIFSPAIEQINVLHTKEHLANCSHQRVRSCPGTSKVCPVPWFSLCKQKLIKLFHCS